MHDRRNNWKLTTPRGQFQKIERRGSVSERRKHTNPYRFLYIDVLSIWGLLVSKL
jgi:hypothetical protein